jgi:response regulator RpfG family c-di-GMP phosphodiesterase
MEKRMPKILIVDDDDALRNLMKMRLAGTYEVIDTGNPVQALGLALEHKPDAILLDLMMPNTSGFELCESLHTLSYTSRIPIFIVSGESALKYREHVASLGAKGFFEKPVNFTDLKKRLSDEIQAQHAERRAHVRVRMRLVLKLKGQDESGRSFEQLTTTENVSAGGVLCNFTVGLGKDAILDVFISSAGHDCFVGRVRPARIEAPETPWQRYGFQFVERSKDWILQD